MTVRHDDNAGTWYYRFSRNGKSYFQGGFRIQQQAAKAEIRKKDELMREETYPTPIGSNLSFRDAAQWFFDEYSRKRKDDWMVDRARIGFMQGFFEGKLLKQIQPSDVQAMREALALDGRSELTVNHYQSLFRAIINRVIKFGKFVGGNPACQVEMAKVERVRVRFLFPSEEKDLTPVVRQHKDLFPYYLMGMFTGMRLGELCGIRVKDISLPLSHVFVSRTKTNRSRYVPLHDEMRPYLASWMQGKEPDSLVLGNYHRCTVGHWFTEVCRKAGVKDFSFHCLRHSFVANMLGRGESLYKVAKIIGDSVATTEKHYGHLDPRCLQDAIAKIGGVVSGSLQSGCSGEVEGRVVNVVELGEKSTISPR